MYDIRSTPLTCCSIGVATASSSVFASAPTYTALRRISGGAMFGNWATGRPTIVTTPTMTIRMAITSATIGRLMKNFDMITALPEFDLPFFQRPHLDRRVSQPREFLRGLCLGLAPQLARQV